MIVTMRMIFHDTTDAKYQINHCSLVSLTTGRLDGHHPHDHHHHHHHHHHHNHQQHHHLVRVDEQLGVIDNGKAGREGGHVQVGAVDH